MNKAHQLVAISLIITMCTAALLFGVYMSERHISLCKKACSPDIVLRCEGGYATCFPASSKRMVEIVNE